MANKPQVAVEPRPDGRWAVRTDSTAVPTATPDAVVHSMGPLPLHACTTCSPARRT